MRRRMSVPGAAAPSEESFLREIGRNGALYVGSPEMVAQKITETVRTVGATRFDLEYGMGGAPHAGNGLARHLASVRARVLDHLNALDRHELLDALTRIGEACAKEAQLRPVSE